MSNLRQCHKKITAANHGEMQAVAIGTAEIKVIIAGNKQTIKVEDVLYVPGLAANLLSVEKIAMKEYEIRITKKGCKITDSKGKLTAADH